MLKFLSSILVLFTLSLFTNAQISDADLEHRFRKLLTANWEIVFSDNFSEPWQKNWFLDGEKATLRQAKDGLEFWAGPDEWDDSSHAVLWTENSYEGNIKIQFDYMRLDSAIKFVNILYIQATGSGENNFAVDIKKWNDYRKIPEMRKYFLNMNAYHISYAAFGTSNEDAAMDYVRARRYTPSLESLRGSELKPDYAETGLFTPNKWNKITLLKIDQELFMNVVFEGKDYLFYWKNENLPPVHAGRIGIRHMYTRGSKYANFSISRYN